MGVLLVWGTRWQQLNELQRSKFVSTCVSTVGASVTLSDRREVFALRRDGYCYPLTPLHFFFIWLGHFLILSLFLPGSRFVEISALVSNIPSSHFWWQQRSFHCLSTLWIQCRGCRGPHLCKQSAKAYQAVAMKLLFCNNIYLCIHRMEEHWALLLHSVWFVFCLVCLPCVYKQTCVKCVGNKYST